VTGTRQRARDDDLLRARHRDLQGCSRYERSDTIVTQYRQGSTLVSRVSAGKSGPRHELAARRELDNSTDSTFADPLTSPLIQD
jgi:hypothetical protein